jgi:hypothetical protein
MTGGEEFRIVIIVFSFVLFYPYKRSCRIPIVIQTVYQTQDSEKRQRRERGKSVFSYGSVSKHRWHIGTPKSPIDSTDRKATQSDWLISLDPDAKSGIQPVLSKQA